MKKTTNKTAYFQFRLTEANKKAIFKMAKQRKMTVTRLLIQAVGLK